MALTKLTPTTADCIVEAVRHGNYNEAAAALAGIDSSTLYRWLQRGRQQPNSEFAVFATRLMEAEAEAEQEMLECVRDQAKVDAVHARWWLERKVPKRWSRKATVKLDSFSDDSAEQSAQILKAVATGEMTVEDAAQMINVVQAGVKIRESAEIFKKLAALEAKIAELVEQRKKE